MDQVIIDLYLKQVKLFISDIKRLFDNSCLDEDEHEIDIDKELKDFEDMDDVEKLNKGLNFNQLITENIFNLFLKCRIKIFSHKKPYNLKISESLFGEKLSFRNLLNNQSDETKKIIWEHIHKLYIITELLKPTETQNLQNIILLKNENNNLNMDNDINTDTNTNTDTSNINTKSKIKNLLNVNENDTTAVMIDDIVESFESVLSGGKNSNIVNGIMETSQKISTKYADLINKGEIDLDKIMKNIFDKVPGMENMMSTFIKQPTEKEDNTKIIMDETFSTANVEVGNVGTDKTGINIGNVLKLADNFGVLPKSNSQDKPVEISENNKLSDILPAQGLEHLNKLINIVNKLDNTSSPNDLNNIKNDMENMLENEFGLQINKLTEDFKHMFKK
jgi:hypothetical protein